MPFYGNYKRLLLKQSVVLAFSLIAEEEKTKFHKVLVNNLIARFRGAERQAETLEKWKMERRKLKGSVNSKYNVVFFDWCWKWQNHY